MHIIANHFRAVKTFCQKIYFFVLCFAYKGRYRAQIRPVSVFFLLGFRPGVSALADICSGPCNNSFDVRRTFKNLV